MNAKNLVLLQAQLINKNGDGHVMVEKVSKNANTYAFTALATLAIAILFFVRKPNFLEPITLACQKQPASVPELYTHKYAIYG